MEKNRKIGTLFPDHLFWDVATEKLNLEIDKDFIIPRALCMTDKSSFDADIQRLESVYSSDQIVKYLKQTKEKISNEVCEVVSKRYTIPVFHRYKLTK